MTKNSQTHTYLNRSDGGEMREIGSLFKEIPVTPDSQIFVSQV